MCPGLVGNPSSFAECFRLTVFVFRFDRTELPDAHASPPNGRSRSSILSLIVRRLSFSSWSILFWSAMAFCCGENFFPASTHSTSLSMFASAG